MNPRQDVRRCRTFLFVPGDRPERFDKARAARPDAVVLDLEDAVQPLRREAARRHVMEWVGSVSADPDRPAVTIRVNETGSADLDLDLQALAEVPGVDALVVPKFGDAASRERCGSLTVPVIGIIESAAGLRGVWDTTPLPDQVVRLSYGAGDFAADTGAEWAANNPAVLQARCQVAWASAAHRLAGPVDTAFPWLADEDGLRRETELARSVGYRGKYCIHPRQLAPVSAAIGPSSTDVAWAAAVLRLWDARAESGGDGAVRLDDTLVDEAVVKRAREIASDAGLDLSGGA